MPTPPLKFREASQEEDAQAELNYCKERNQKQVRDGKEDLTLLVPKGGSASLAGLQADMDRVKSVTRLSIIPFWGMLKSALPHERSLMERPSRRSTNSNASSSSTALPAVAGVDHATVLPRWLMQCQAVTELDLTGNHFDRIPKLVENFPQLKRLCLAQNPVWHAHAAKGSCLRCLNSFFEAQLHKLPALRHLDLRSCGIDWVPRDFGSLGLTSLNLHGHCFTSLPPALKDLTSLKELDLSREEEPERHTRLPLWLNTLELRELNLTLFGVHDLPGHFWNSALGGALEVLTVSAYILPSDCSALTCLKSLTIHEAGNIAIPFSFNTLRCLERFAISRSTVKSLPRVSSSGPLPCLRHVSLEGSVTEPSALHESFLKLISNASHLNLQGNGLTGLPDVFDNFKGLEQLLLAGNDLEALPDTFCGLSTLVDTGAVFKSLCGLPENVGGLRSLSRLQIHGSGLCWRAATLPSSLCEMKALETLSLKSLTTLCALPESFCLLPSLKHLTLEDLPKLTALPSLFGRLKELRELSISSEILDLPSSFVDLRLTELRVRANPQVDVLLERISGLRELRKLDLSFNTFTVLPECIGNLGSLKHLGLDGCHELTTLPDSIYRLSNVSLLDLSSTNVKADFLPSTLGMMNPKTSLQLPGRPRHPAWLFVQHGSSELEEISVW